MGRLLDEDDVINTLWDLRRNLQMMDDSQIADLILHGVFFAEKRIERLPSAQPEIVRCKDCKYYKKDHGYTVCTISPLHKVIRKPDDYCSRAGRREDGKTN